MSSKGNQISPNILNIKKRGRGVRTTYHLEGGEVLLPPDVLLVLGAHRRDHVVEVHDDVDESVEEGEEGRVAARGELEAHPDGEGHDAVMDHVERRHVLALLAQDEEELRMKFGTLI